MLNVLWVKFVKIINVLVVVVQIIIVKKIDYVYMEFVKIHVFYLEPVVQTHIVNRLHIKHAVNVSKIIVEIRSRVVKSFQMIIVNKINLVLWAIFVKQIVVLKAAEMMLIVDSKKLVSVNSVRMLVNCLVLVA